MSDLDGNCDSKVYKNKEGGYYRLCRYRCPGPDDPDFETGQGCTKYDEECKKCGTISYTHQIEYGFALKKPSHRKKPSHHGDRHHAHVPAGRHPKHHVSRHQTSNMYTHRPDMPNELQRHGGMMLKGTRNCTRVYIWGDRYFHDYTFVFPDGICTNPYGN